jgi:hypothetical protein
MSSAGQQVSARCPDTLPQSTFHRTSRQSLRSLGHGRTVESHLYDSVGGTVNPNREEPILDGRRISRRGVFVLGAGAAAGTSGLVACEGEDASNRRPGQGGEDGLLDYPFADKLREARSAVRSGAPSGSADPLGTYVIELPPGDFRINDIHGLLGVEEPESKAWGLKFRGAGPGLTTIIFDPPSPGALCFNDYWLGLRFEGLRFVAAAADCTFMQSYTTHNAQDYAFVDCEWIGWKYVFDLQGDNNNSEFRFYGCATSNLQDNGAFLYIGPEATSDQFLNYWFFGFKHWSTSAAVIDAHRGGHFQIFGLDASDWGSSLRSTAHLFNLRGASHAEGVCSFLAEGVRVEAKNDAAALLFTEWPQGNVTFQNLDWSSQQKSYSYRDIIELKYSNVGGATVVFRDSQLAGGVRVRYGENDWRSPKAVVFERCNWAQRLTPSEVVGYDDSDAGSSLAPPMVEFIGCRNRDDDASGEAGLSAWEARVGWNGQLMVDHPRRSLSVRGRAGLIAAGDNAVKVHLPVGALVTGLRVMAPAGATSSQQSGAVWSVTTAEDPPLPVASSTVPGRLDEGFDVTARLDRPFLCGTRAGATLTFTSTADQALRQGLLVLEGYW